MSSETAGALVGLALDGYTVKQMTEVFSVDEDGKRRLPEESSFFKDDAIARAWAQGQSGGANFNKTASVLVITNGHRFFVFGGQEFAPYGDELALSEARERALAKLTAEERSILGL